MRGDHNAADEARRDLRAETLAEHIKAVVDAAPPLTDEQRQRLSQLLSPTAAQNCAGADS